jgi:hypothetical protein
MAALYRLQHPSNGAVLHGREQGVRLLSELLSQAVKVETSRIVVIAAGTRLNMRPPHLDAFDY